MSTCALEGCMASATKYCGGCHEVAYCNRAHQVSHWKLSHKRACKKQGKSQSSKRVVIIGGGVIGVCIAYYLTLRGLKPLLVEKTAIACAASGKAGGFLAAHWHKPNSCRGPLMQESFRLHCQLAQKLNGALNYTFRHLDALGLDMPEPGVITSVQDRARIQEVEALGGVDIDWVTGSILDARLMGDASQVAQVHPKLFVDTVLKTAIQQGAEVRIGEVTGLVLSSPDSKLPEGKRKVTGVVIDSDAEPVQADVVVLAMGPWTHLARRWLGSSVPLFLGQKCHSITIRPALGPIASTPSSTQASAQADPSNHTSAPLSTSFQNLSFETNLSEDTQQVSPGLQEEQDYTTATQRLPALSSISAEAMFVTFSSKNRELDINTTPTYEFYPRTNGEVYLHGVDEKWTLVSKEEDASQVVPTEGACERLREVAGHVSGYLREGKVELEQSCYMPLVPDGEAVLGALPDVEGVLIAAGHVEWGILLGPITGKLISELIVDGKSSMDLAAFRPDRQGIDVPRKTKSKKAPQG